MKGIKKAKSFANRNFALQIYKLALKYQDWNTRICDAKKEPKKERKEKKKKTWTKDT